MWLALLPLASQLPVVVGRDTADAGPWDVIKTLSTDGGSTVRYADFANQMWCRRDLHLLLQHGWDARKRGTCMQQPGTPYFA